VLCTLRHLATKVAELLFARTDHMMTGRVEVDVPAAGWADLVSSTAILAVQELLVVLLGGLDLLSAAVEGDAGAGIFLVEWLGASHASTLLAGGAFTDSREGVDRVAGYCRAHERATRAVDSLVWVECVLTSLLVVALEEIVVDVSGESSEVDQTAVHPRGILFLMLDGSAEDIVEACAAGPDAVHEDLFELRCVVAEGFEADVASFLGGVGHLGGVGLRG